MKKVFLELILMSTLRNGNGNYAYRVVSAKDKDGKDESLDDYGNVREYDDGYTLFSREKLGARDKKIKAVGLERTVNGRQFLNLENKAGLARAEALEAQFDADEDLVRRVSNISKVAQRTGMNEKGQEILIGTVAGSLFAGVGQTVKRSVVKVNTEETEETKEEKPETPQGHKNLKTEEDDIPSENEQETEQETESATEGAGNASAPKGKK
jgi:hypothetical protein